MVKALKVLWAIVLVGGPIAAGVTAGTVCYKVLPGDDQVKTTVAKQIPDAVEDAVSDWGLSERDAVQKAVDAYLYYKQGYLINYNQPSTSGETAVFGLFTVSATDDGLIATVQKYVDGEFVFIDAIVDKEEYEEVINLRSSLTNDALENELKDEDFKEYLSTALNINDKHYSKKANIVISACAGVVGLSVGAYCMFNANDVVEDYLVDGKKY